MPMGGLRTRTSSDIYRHPRKGGDDAGVADAPSAASQAFTYTQAVAPLASGASTRT